VPVYEYATVYVTLETDWNELKKIGAGSAAAVETKITLWLPGAAEAQTIATPNVHELLNELGKDGWRLAASDGLDTALVYGWHGWPEVGTAVRQRLILMREAPDD